MASKSAAAVSTRPGAYPADVLKRLDLFPISTSIAEHVLTTGGLGLQTLAAEFGTPLYVYDQLTMDTAVAAYREALRAWYPGMGEITYAGKAFLCRAVAEWIREQNICVDCTGEGEIGIALTGKVPRESIVVHGVNKSDGDLCSALRHAGTIVVDNFSELRRLAALQKTTASDRLPDIWLRLLPGVTVATHHAHTQTGQQGSKFGMTPEELAEAAQFCKQNGLQLKGLHFHQGSNFRDPGPLVSAIELGLDLVKQIGLGNDWYFCPGGGWSVAYHEDELPQPDIDLYVRLIAQTVIETCRKLSLPLPTLHLEPGRSLIARAGIAIYRIGVIKRRPEITWLLVDGGMADNPRHALYGSKYSCLPVTGLSRAMNERVSIAGPYCESGDVLIENLQMPQMDEGELIAIPAGGAYQLSMSSNYNGARRPAVVWLADGHARLVVRREALADLSDRDLSS